MHSNGEREEEEECIQTNFVY